MTVIVYVDGLCEPVNPGGVACWGFIIYRNGVKQSDGRGVVGRGSRMSNNLAEYTALVKALKELINLGWQNEEVIIRSDSRLLVNQMTGWWGVRGGYYYPAYVEAFKLAQRFPQIRFAWVPREQNREADALSRQAYEEYCKAEGLKPKYGTRRRRVFKPQKGTCYTCRWVRFSGPHVGCFKDSKYRKWLPKRFAKYGRCPDYEEAGEG